MATWIFPTTVNKNKPYYYEVDRALETLKTIFWGQSRPIKNIAVGDIVYIYESSPVQAIGWKCRVIDVKVPPQNIDIDDSEFEHGYDEGDDSYIKITALAKYDGDKRQKLSLDKLEKNGLTQKRSSHRVNPQLLSYINSVEPSVVYDD